MIPNVTGGADLLEGGAIGISEMEGVGDVNGAVVFVRGRGGSERACLSIQGSDSAVGCVMPDAWLGGHEAKAIGAIAIVESSDSGFDAMRLLMVEGCGEGYIQERVAVGGALEGEFEHSPLLDRGLGGVGDERKESEKEKK